MEMMMKHVKPFLKKKEVKRKTIIDKIQKLWD